MIAQLVGGFIVIVIAVMLLPTIAEQTQTIRNSTNVNGASSILLGLVPLLFALSIGAVAIVVVADSFRNIGLLGGDDEISEDDYRGENSSMQLQKQKPHKQTYLEYVKERRAVEKIMNS